MIQSSSLNPFTDTYPLFNPKSITNYQNNPKIPLIFEAITSDCIEIILSFLNFKDLNAFTLTSQQCRVSVKSFFFSHSYSSEIDSFENEFETIKAFQQFKLFFESKQDLIQKRCSFKGQIILLYKKQTQEALQLIHEGLLSQVDTPGANLKLNEVIPFLMNHGLEASFPELFSEKIINFNRFDFSSIQDKSQIKSRFIDLKPPMNDFLNVLTQYLLMRIAVNDLEQINLASQIIYKRNSWSMIWLVNNCKKDKGFHNQLRRYAHLKIFELNKDSLYEGMNLLPLRKGSKTVFDIANKNIFGLVLQFLSVKEIFYLRQTSNGMRIIVQNFLELEVNRLERIQEETISNFQDTLDSKLTIQLVINDLHFEYIQEFLLSPGLLESYYENNTKILIQFLLFLKKSYAQVLKTKEVSPIWSWRFEAALNNLGSPLNFFLNVVDKNNCVSPEGIIEIAQKQNYKDKLLELAEFFKFCDVQIPRKRDNIYLSIFIYQTSKHILLLKKLLDNKTTLMPIFQLNGIQTHLFLNYLKELIQKLA